MSRSIYGQRSTTTLLPQHTAYQRSLALNNTQIKSNSHLHATHRLQRYSILTTLFLSIRHRTWHQPTSRLNLTWPVPLYSLSNLVLMDQDEGQGTLAPEIFHARCCGCELNIPKSQTGWKCPREGCSHIICDTCRRDDQWRHDKANSI